MTIRFNWIPFVLLLLACGKEGEVPAYLSVPAYTLTTTTDEGSASHKITDVWVFVEGQSIGAYQLPSLIPVVGVGPTELDFFPVIKENGILAFSIMYPFYTKTDTVIDLQPNETIELDLTTSYQEDINFAVIEVDSI